MCLCVHTCAMVWYTQSQSTTLGSWCSPSTSLVPWNRTCVIKFDRKHYFLLSHVSSPCGILVTGFPKKMKSERLIFIVNLIGFNDTRGPSEAWLGVSVTQSLERFSWGKMIHLESRGPPSWGLNKKEKRESLPSIPCSHSSVLPDPLRREQAPSLTAADSPARSSVLICIPWTKS